ncbi:MAG: NAD(P)/FAD-dependent oxidoreductase [bacterium]
MTAHRSVVIAGAGIIGVTSALELRRRGYDVTLADPGPLPHPDAASTDVNKAIRMDYGSDTLYIEMMEEAFRGWDEWNRCWPEPPYHQDGFLLLAASPMRAGEFEGDSYATLTRRGYALERLDARALAARFPAWRAAPYPDGYINPRGGWAESGRVVARLVEVAREEGVVLREGVRFARLVEEGSRVVGIELASANDGAARDARSGANEIVRADFVIAAAGAWTPALIPQLAGVIDIVGQPVLHFAPRDPAPFRAPHFSVWTADITNTGWYGFPALPNGIVKIGNHGPGRPMHPDAPRHVTDEEIARFRAFTHAALPDLADAPIASTRVCLYSDSWDGDFYIDHDPDRPGLLFATGGSGHAFKFAPILGALVADTLERKSNRYAPRFAWRARGGGKKEQARFKAPDNTR